MQQGHISRSFDILNPAARDVPINIIGCGATGSHVGLMLARLGLRNIHFWDADEVELHNVSNQVYQVTQVGIPKVIAMKEILSDVLDGVPGSYVFNEKFYTPAETRLSGVVFLLVDSMQTRKEIWEHSLRYNSAVPLMLESRMGVRSSSVLTINPVRDVQFWESRWVSDDEVQEETTACGASQTMGPTAQFTASLLVWQMVHWWNDKNYSRELLASFDPPGLIDNDPYNAKAGAV